MRRLVAPAGGDPTLLRLTSDLNLILDEIASRLNRPPSSTVADLPATVGVGTQRYVTDESGGAVTAVFDGTDWRRVTDNVVVS